METAKAVEILWQGLQAGVHYPEPLKGQLTLVEGYRVQLGVLARAVSTGERQAGWKIGLTADAVRRGLGFESPVFGYLLESRAFPSGASFRVDDIVSPAIECELCLTLGRPLRGPGVTREQALIAVAAVAPALEVVSFRGNMRADFPLGIADNVSQWAFVTGASIRPYPRDLALGQVTVEVLTNGQTVGRYVGAEVIDDQLASLAWLANQLAEHGWGLEAGQRVITGSFNPPAPVHRGERWEARFSASLGTVTAIFS
jgi:2-keto-4-pentenoate hydratase